MARQEIKLTFKSDEPAAEVARRVRMFLETHPVLSPALLDVGGADLPDPPAAIIPSPSPEQHGDAPGADE